MQVPALERPTGASWSTAFITRLHRYKTLLMRRWWIPLLTICLGLFVEAWIIYQTPPSFLSQGKMILAGKLNIAQGAVYSEDSQNFYGTQIQLMQGSEVKRSAEALVRSTHPEMQPVKVDIAVIQKPRTSIFDLQAIGSTGDYTQAYLNAVMQKYLDFKKGMREDQGHTITTGITEQLIQTEKELRNAEDEMLEFQKQNNIGFIQEEGNSAAAYLVRLNREHAGLKTQYELLTLLDLDQNLDRAQSNKGDAPSGTENNEDKGLPFSDVGPESEYLKAKQEVQLLKAERDTLSKDLRPKHPKILKLNDDIDKEEKLIQVFRQDTVEKLETRRKSIGKQMENLQTNIKEWEAKALDLSQRLAQFNRVKGKVDRLKMLYDRLTNNLKEVDVSQVVDSADQVSIMEMGSPPISVRPGLLKGLLVGLGCGAVAGIAILLLLDRIDDRMASFGEFQHQFSENVLGQIPKKSEGQNHVASGGGCAARLRRVLSQRAFVDLLHALRGTAPENTSHHQRRAERRKIHHRGQSRHHHGALRRAHLVDRRRSAARNDSRSLWPFLEDRILGSAQAGSELAGSSSADGIPEPVHSAPRQELVAAE